MRNERQQEEDHSPEQHVVEPYGGHNRDGGDGENATGDRLHPHVSLNLGGDPSQCASDGTGSRRGAGGIVDFPAEPLPAGKHESEIYDDEHETGADALHARQDVSGEFRHAHFTNDCRNVQVRT